MSDTAVVSGSHGVAADRFTAQMEAALPGPEDYLATLERSYPNMRMPVQAAGKSQGDLP